MSTTGWGFFQQGADQQLEVHELGLRLNKVLDCSIHWPAWGKNLYECKHGVTFMPFMIKGYSDDKLKEIHEEGKKLRGHMD